MPSVTNYIIAGIIIGIVVFCIMREVELRGLKADKAIIESDLATAIANSIIHATERDELIEALHIQADDIEWLERAKRDAVSDFERWKAKHMQSKSQESKQNVTVIYRGVDTNRSKEERSCEDLRIIERNTYDLDWNGMQLRTATDKDRVRY